jgi:hypothetical protein
MGKPTQLKFYPPGWTAILERAKEHMRHFISLVSPFPNDHQEPHLTTAREFVNEALAEFKEKKAKVEPGTCILIHYIYS